MKKRTRKKWLKQHGKYFAPNECWSLDITIAEFTLPRLKYLKEHTIAYPGIGEMNTFEKWQAGLDKMINAFELISKPDDAYGVWDIEKNTYEEIKPLLEQKQKEVDEGLELFGKWFQRLGW